MSNKSESGIDPLYFQLFDLRPTKGNRKKLKIVERAIELISDEGIEGLTFESVGISIGVKPSHIAYHFPDKGEIVDFAFRYMIATMQSYLVKAVHPKRTGRKQVEGYVNASFKYLKENPSHWTLISLFFYYCSRDKKYRAMYRSVLDAGTERVCAMLGSGGKKSRANATEIVEMLHTNAMRFFRDQTPGSFEKIRARSVEVALEFSSFE